MFKLSPKLSKVSYCRFQKCSKHTGCESGVLVGISRTTEMSVSVRDGNQTLFRGFSDYTSEIQSCLKADHISQRNPGFGIHNQCHFCLTLLCAPLPSSPAFSPPRLQLNANALLAQSFLFRRALPVVVVTIKTNHFNFLVSYFIHLL